MCQQARNLSGKRNRRLKYQTSLTNYIPDLSDTQTRTNIFSIISSKYTGMNSLAPWRTFSIFISSTFADMQAERDHLKNIVFPKVEEELRKKRIRLETVDLRWGVETSSVNEDEREATILKVCLEEIERCKPFFIGLLGDRYGWVPPEERIENATVGRNGLLPYKGKSVTALEIEFGVLAGTEQLNRSVFYLREPLPYEKLSPEKAAKFSDQFDPNLTEEEKRKREEALEKLKTAIRSHFNIINLPEKVKTYTAKLNPASGTMVYGLESWGEVVYRDILAECEKHAEDTWGEAPKDHHEQEVALLEAFIEEHTHITTTITEKGEDQVHTFCGRKKLIGELREHLLSDNKDKWGIVLTGESGSGKSAVFSMMYKTIMKEDCLVLAHSAGISPNARSVADLLRKWNRQLRELLGIEEEKEVQELGPEIRAFEGERLIEGDIKKATPKTGIEKLQEKFSELLYQASGKKRVVLLLDALDRFEPTSRAQYMTWLPESIPPSVRVLITAITGTEKNSVQYHKGLIAKNIEHFTVEEAKEMLFSLGRKQHKSLPKALKKEILEKTREDGLNACSSPLWLSLAVNILMAIDSDDFEKMSRMEGKSDQQIGNYMLDMVRQFPSLPGDLFMELIEKASGIFGEHFTKTLFNFIACSRGGLRESDLEMLLPKQTSEDWDPLRFASLRRWFRMHLVEQGEGHQWNLAHSILRNTLKDRMEPGNFEKMHILISSHLLALPVTDALRTTETMYHLLQVDDKIPAIEYYTSELETEPELSATKILSVLVTIGEEGLQVVSSFPSLVANREEILLVLLYRFITLNDYLKEEGNLNQRLTILTRLYTEIENSFGDHIPIRYFKEVENSSGDKIPIWKTGYYKGSLYEKLGSIHQDMGHMEEALIYYEKLTQLGGVLCEVNPQNEWIKNMLDVSYSRLGYLHQIMGHLDESLKYFERSLRLSNELYETNPKDELLKYNLAIANEKIGDIHQASGHIEEAIKFFEVKLKLHQEIYNTNPNNEVNKFGLSLANERLGQIRKEMGHLEKALYYLKEYNHMCKELHEVNPRNQMLKHSLSVSYSRLGSIFQEMGHLEEALNCFEKNSSLKKEIYEANPFNETYKHGLAESYWNLGFYSQETGRTEEALKYYELCLALGSELSMANPQKEELKVGLKVTYERLGVIHKEMGQMKMALNYFQKYNQLVKELFEKNPHKISHKDSLAESYSRLGSIFQEMGHMEEALNCFEKNSSLRKDIFETNPFNETFKHRLANSYLSLGDFHKAMGHMEAEINYFEEGTRLFKELYESNPLNESLKNGLAISYSKLGEFQQAMGHMEEAIKYIEQFNQLEKELYESNPRNESLKRILAISYSKLGEIQQAMGNMEEAVEYFEQYNQLNKEQYESNPRNNSLLEGLGISYYKLAVIYKEMGNDEKGKAYFSQWKNIISILLENLPQVPKYMQWNEMEY
jgi:tetratricopeptide (TPR) repeat protein